MSTEVKHPFTVDQYHKMVDAGILGKEDRVELIEGEIVKMSAMGSRQAEAVRRLTELFVQALGKRAVVSIQLPVDLPPHSVPEPDVAVVGRRDDYSRRHPTSEDVLLAIEVTDTSQKKDREVKRHLYARHRIREYWIVNVEKDRIEVHRSSDGEDYTDIRNFGRGQTVCPEAFPDLKVEIDVILG